MALIARLQHPYIVEFKEAWVEKVRSLILFSSAELTIISLKLVIILLSCQSYCRAAMFALLPAIAKVVICKSLYNFSFSINLTAKLKFNNAFDRAELMKKANGQYFPEEVC